MVTPNKLHKYQHHLAQYIYPFYANIITTIGGIRSNFWSRHNRKVALKHNLSLLITVSFYIVLPTLITNGSIYYFILMYLVYQCVLFYGIYIGSAINHFVPQVADKIPHEHINKYAYYICHNTTNFSLNNKFWFWYTGGFNIQIEHHLIPFVPVENLRRMTKIVKELCEKYNYPYKEFKTMSQLWKEHYNYLAIMANAEITEIIKTEINNKHSYEAR